MDFSKIPEFRKAPNLSEQLADFLLKEIDNGSIKPGQELLSESELSYRFNLSRATVREALAHLKHHGAIEKNQGSPTKITAIGSRRFFKLHTPQKIDLKIIVNLYEFRAGIQALAAELAALHRTDEDLKVLEKCLLKMRSYIDRGIDGTDLNYNFHKAIVASSHNPFFQGLIEFLSDKLWVLIQKSIDSGANSEMNVLPDERSIFEKLSEQAQQEHEQMYKAILRGDSAEARSACLSHSKNAASRRGLKVFYNTNRD